MVKHFRVKGLRLSNGLVNKQKGRIKAKRRGRAGVGDGEVPPFKKEKIGEERNQKEKNEKQANKKS